MLLLPESGGDPEIANKIIERMMSGLGDDEIDPAMMAALMATTALVAAGASNEEVSEASLSYFIVVAVLPNVKRVLWPDRKIVMLAFFQRAHSTCIFGPLLRLSFFRPRRLTSR
jgi:hypothetical protein